MNRQRDFQRFPILVLYEEICAEHYPDIKNQWDAYDRKNRETSYNVQKPEIRCTWPAVYIDTFTVHYYRQTVLNSPEPGVEPFVLDTEKHPTVPRQIFCAQCRGGFENLRKFKAHIKGEA